MNSKIFTALCLISFLTISCAGVGFPPSQKEFENADFGQYPSNIEEIVTKYLVANNFDSSFETDFEIKKPKKYWTRNRHGSGIVYGYATQVSVGDKQYFTLIRDGYILIFEKWNYSTHGTDSFDSLIRFKIDTILDKFDGFTIHRMQDNLLGMEKDSFGGIELNVQQFIKDGRTSCSLIVSYTGLDWLFIDEGETLVLLVDGERLQFSGKGSYDHRDVERGYSLVTIKEKAWYDITLEQLKKITFAQDVKVKVKGRSHFLTRFFTELNFDAFRRFYKKYVKNDSA